VRIGFVVKYENQPLYPLQNQLLDARGIVFGEVFNHNLLLPSTSLNANRSEENTTVYLYASDVGIKHERFATPEEFFDLKRYALFGEEHFVWQEGVFEAAGIKYFVHGESLFGGNEWASALRN
jgi:hypothetical protein